MKKMCWLGVVAAVGLLAGCTGSAEEQKIRDVPPTDTIHQPWSLIEVHMADEKTGWAISPGNVYRTEDGAESWKSVLTFNYTDTMAPSELKPLDPAKLHIAYLGADEIWNSEAVVAGAYPYIVQHTADGGRNGFKKWDTFPARGVGAIQFVDSKHGWMFEKFGSATSNDIVNLSRTEDGGTTWIRVSGNGRGEPVETFPDAGMKSGISFADSLHGFATGSLRDVDTAFFYRTDVGGKSWKEQALPVHSTTLWTYPPEFFKNGAEGVMAAEDSTAHTITMISTLDGGQTWLPGKPISYQPRPAQESALDRDGRRLDVVNDFSDVWHGWVMDQTGGLYATKDGGTTWETIPADETLKHALMESRVKQLNFVNEHTGWALMYQPNGVTSTLLKTTDGGHTWH